MLVFDATALIDIQQGHPKVIGFFERHSEEDCVVPLQVATEYLVRFEDRADVLALLERSFRLEVPTRHHAVAAAALRAASMRRVAWPDILIATHAKVGGGTIVTSNVPDFVALGVDAVDPRH